MNAPDSQTAGSGGAIPLALHTWTLDTTPLEETLRIVRAAGWNAIELRRVDFARARAAGRTDRDVIDAVQASGLATACVGGLAGWMTTTGEDYERLFAEFVQSCEFAAALGAPVVMNSIDREAEPNFALVDRLYRAGDVAGRHGVRLALEGSCLALRLNALAPVRDLVRRLAHPQCGLLFDTYHFHRSGGAPDAIASLTASEIAYVQYSDVPAVVADPKAALDRLPPGEGVAPISEMFAALYAAGYRGAFSFEAPNPETWREPPELAARRALDATLRAMLKAGLVSPA